MSTIMTSSFTLCGFLQAPCIKHYIQINIQLKHFRTKSSIKKRFLWLLCMNVLLTLLSECFFTTLRER